MNTQDNKRKILYYGKDFIVYLKVYKNAGVAQLVEQLICNQ
jgi:hypothetical protein